MKIEVRAKKELCGKGDVFLPDATIYLFFQFVNIKISVESVIGLFSFSKDFSTYPVAFSFGQNFW